MSKAIGMVEYKTTSAGVVAADSMVKTSEVSIIEAQTVCPGKYIVIITGDLSESYDASSIIVAADEAAKTAIVDLIEVRLARGMCGKSYLMLTGEVAAVEAAIDRAKEAVSDDGMYLDSAVIAHPDAQIRDAIL